MRKYIRYFKELTKAITNAEMKSILKIQVKGSSHFNILRFVRDLYSIWSLFPQLKNEKNLWDCCCVQGRTLVISPELRRHRGHRTSRLPRLRWGCGEAEEAGGDEEPCALLVGPRLACWSAGCQQELGVMQNKVILIWRKVLCYLLFVLQLGYLFNLCPLLEVESGERKSANFSES